MRPEIPTPERWAKLGHGACEHTNALRSDVDGMP